MISAVEPIQRVGRPYGAIRKPKDKSEPLFTYAMVKKDSDGWANPSKFLPLEYDLVDVKIGKKIKTIWHTGSQWDGLHHIPGSKIDAWKKNIEVFT